MKKFNIVCQLFKKVKSEYYLKCKLKCFKLFFIVILIITAYSSKMKENGISGKKVYKTEMSSFWKVCGFFHAMLGQVSFSMNYCISEVRHEGHQPVALLRSYWSSGCSDSSLQLIWIVGWVFLIFLLTTPHRSSVGFRPGQLAGQSSTVVWWSAEQLVVALALWADAKSCWNRKPASP